MKTYVYAERSLFEPVALMPSQVDHSTPLGWAHRLIVAVVEEAMNCLHKRPRLVQETHAWFCSESEQPFSFLWCCAHLKMNPAPFRKHAKKMLAAVPAIAFEPKPHRVGPVAYPNVICDKSRRAHFREAPYLAGIQIRSGANYRKTIKTINLYRWAWTREEARRISQEFIKSGAWKDAIEQKQEAA